jgi:hypothetical protein
MGDLVRAGEAGIGFENLCTQLYEYDVSVDDRTLSQLKDIGGHMGLESNTNRKGTSLIFEPKEDENE